MSPVPKYQLGDEIRLICSNLEYSSIRTSQSQSSCRSNSNELGKYRTQNPVQIPEYIVEMLLVYEPIKQLLQHGILNIKLAQRWCEKEFLSIK